MKIVDRINAIIGLNVFGMLACIVGMLFNIMSGDVGLQFVFAGICIMNMVALYQDFKVKERMLQEKSGEVDE